MDKATRPQLIDHVPEDLVASMVYSPNAETQARFRADHGEMIQRAIRGIYDAHSALERFRSHFKGDLRTGTIDLFLHSAVHSVLCATHHLVSGYPVAAGNMMRHHTEAVSMALLCLDQTSGVLEAFSANRKGFAVDNAPTRLRQRKRRQALKTLIEFDEEAWEKVLELNELYSALSHASALSLAHTLMLSTDTGMILGSEYDPSKSDAYAKDLRRCTTAAESLANLIGVIIAATPAPLEAA